MENNLLTSAEVARILKVSAPTLSRWRSSRAGPRHIDLNGIPRYSAVDVQAFIEGKRK